VEYVLKLERSKKPFPSREKNRENTSKGVVPSRETEIANDHIPLERN